MYHDIPVLLTLVVIAGKKEELTLIGVRHDE